MQEWNRANQALLDPEIRKRFEDEARREKREMLAPTRIRSQRKQRRQSKLARMLGARC
jgi:hypothetical protein